MNRRHRAPEAKSDLRDQRYNREKKAEGRPAGKLPENQGETAERLAAQYQVSRDTIQKGWDLCRGRGHPRSGEAGGIGRRHLTPEARPTHG
jgi:hypothetical protein